MKKVLCYFSAAAAIAVLALSCAKEPKQNEVTPTGKGIVFQAESSVLQTKTTIENGTGSERIVKWAAGDKVAVWWGSEQSAVGEAAEAGTSTWFEVEAGVAENYYAVYPSSAGVAFEEGVLTTQVPAVQTGAFADANIAVATASAATRKFQFHNATAVVKFEITSADYDKAVFRGAKGEAIAGKLPVSFTESDITPGTATETATEIEIPLNGAGVYYFAVLPVQLEKGFSVSLYKGETADPAAFASASCDLQAGTLLNLEVLDGKSVSNLFVTPEGAGKKSGKSWENAMGTAELRALLSESASAAILDGVTIHMAAGEYYLAGEAEGVVNLSFPEAANPVDISFLGGYPADLAGTTLAGRDTTQYRTVLTGKEDARILTVGDKLNVAFDGISFQDARTPDDQSGALFIKGTSTTVSLKSCRFVNNKNTNSGKSGAAVILAGGGLAAEDCYFAGNYARNAGALLLRSGSDPVLVSKCLFENNTAINTSGAAQNSGLKDVTFSECEFRANKAYDEEVNSWGGGAFHTGSSAETTFVDCTFSGNIAKRCGGAISLEGAKVTCTGCSFSGNSAEQGDQTKGSADNKETAVTGMVGGGAIIVRNAADVLEINRCSFNGNSAPNGNGGAIGVQNAAATVTINAGTVFEGNTAYYHGASIFAWGGLTIKGTSDERVYFNKEHTLSTANQFANGGAIWLNEKTTSTLSYVEFGECEAGQEASGTVNYSNGGAISMKGVTSFLADHCDFWGCRGRNGGCLNLELGSGVCKFTNCDFHDNILRSGAGKDGTSGNFHGSVARLSYGTVEFEKCTFDKNVANNGSGAFHLNNDASATVKLTDCTASGNGCINGNGGFCGVERGSLYMENCSLEGNYVTSGSSNVRNGGAIYMDSNALKIEAKGCTFKGNHIDGSGNAFGGVMRTQANCEAIYTDCVFDGNHSTYRGAVFALNASTRLKVNRCLFKNNYGTGGGIIQSGANCIVYLNASAFVDNYTTAAKGWGVVVHSGNGNYCINNCTFYNNVNKNGTGAYVQLNSDGGWLIVNSTLVGPTTTSDASSALVRDNGTRKLVLCNNILLNTGTDAADRSFTLKNSGVFSDYGHNVLSATSNPANGAFVATDVLGSSASTLGGTFAEQWTTQPHYGVYTWNGSLPGFTPAVQADVESAMATYTETDTVHTDITSIGADFKAWLASLDYGYAVDGRGIARTGAWWPGAYQAN